MGCWDCLEVSYNCRAAAYVEAHFDFADRLSGLRVHLATSLYRKRSIWCLQEEYGFRIHRFDLIKDCLGCINQLLWSAYCNEERYFRGLGAHKFGFQGSPPEPEDVKLISILEPCEVPDG